MKKVFAVLLVFLIFPSYSLAVELPPHTGFTLEEFWELYDSSYELLFDETPTFPEPSKSFIDYFLIYNYSMPSGDIFEVLSIDDYVYGISVSRYLPDPSVSNLSSAIDSMSEYYFPLFIIFPKGVSLEQGADNELQWSKACGSLNFSSTGEAYASISPGGINFIYYLDIDTDDYSMYVSFAVAHEDFASAFLN